MNKKVLVTGGNGQLALTIKELYEINDSNIDFTFVTKRELDITKEHLLKKHLKENQFNYCINCAAYTNVEQAEKTPEIAYEVNAKGVKLLAETCKKHKIILIHISTDYVFDGEKNEPYTVMDKPNPINQYGKSKLLGEKYIQEILDSYFIVRTSWLYSRKYGKNFYATILSAAKEKQNLFVIDKQKGCPTNTESLASYIINLILSEPKHYGLKHFCDQKIMTWYDFAKQILKENNLFNIVKLARAKNYSTFAKRPKNSVLKNEAL